MKTDPYTLKLTVDLPSLPELGHTNYMPTVLCEVMTELYSVQDNSYSCSTATGDVICSYCPATSSCTALTCWLVSHVYCEQEADVQTLQHGSCMFAPGSVVAALQCARSSHPWWRQHWQFLSSVWSTASNVNRWSTWTHSIRVWTWCRWWAVQLSTSTDRRCCWHWCHENIGWCRQLTKHSHCCCPVWIVASSCRTQSGGSSQMPGWLTTCLHGKQSTHWHDGTGPDKSTSYCLSMLHTLLSDIVVIADRVMWSTTGVYSALRIAVACCAGTLQHRHDMPELCSEFT